MRNIFLHSYMYRVTCCTSRVSLWRKFLKSITFVIQKVTRKLSLTKVRLAKFNESAHLACFYALSTVWAAYSIINEGFIENLSSLWDNYPQRWLPFWIKLFFITQVRYFINYHFQICYWLHDYPELYFQRVKKVSYVFEDWILGRNSYLHDCFMQQYIFSAYLWLMLEGKYQKNVDRL